MEQLELLRFIILLLDQLQLRYMVVGSYASGAYGEPRLTQDIDIVVDLEPADVDRMIARLPASDFYLSREAALSAIQSGGQFNVIHPESGLKIDFMLARRDPWGREQLARRTRIELLEGVDAYTARPEDVILSKLIYYQEGGSEKHLRDIAGMFSTSGDEIDRNYVQHWVDELSLEDEWKLVLSKLPPATG